MSKEEKVIQWIKIGMGAVAFGTFLAWAREVVILLAMIAHK